MATDGMQHEPLPDIVLVDSQDLAYAGAALHFASEHLSEFREYVQQWNPEDADQPDAAYLYLLRKAHAHITPGCPAPLGTS